MPNIKLTEFIPPYGQTIERELDAPESIFQKWKEMSELGLRVTAETLLTGQVNICIEEPDLGDYDLVVCPNKAEVVKRLMFSMINHFDAHDFAHWKIINGSEEP